MPSQCDLAVHLLEVLDREPSESLRAAARERLERLVAVSAASFEALTPAAALERSLAGVDVRLLRRPGLVGRMVRRFGVLGAPVATSQRPEASSALLCRRLVMLRADQLEAVAADLGRVGVALLCRDLDRGAAARLALRLEGERDAVRELGPLAPGRDASLLRSCCRHLATAGAAGQTGANLVAALGRSLVAGLVAYGEPDVAAALGRRLAIDAYPADPCGAAWTEALERLVGGGEAP